MEVKINSKQIKDEEEENKRILNLAPFKSKIDPGRTSGEVGDATEQYVEQLLKSDNRFQSVQRIGQLGTSGDIVVKLRAYGATEYKLLEVKTLCRVRNSIKESYTIQNNTLYDKSTLLVGVNKYRNRFVLIFSKHFEERKSKTFNFDILCSQELQDSSTMEEEDWLSQAFDPDEEEEEEINNKENEEEEGEEKQQKDNTKINSLSSVFTSESAFLNALVENIPYSVNYCANSYITHSSSTILELQMKVRLKEALRIRNMSYEENTTNNSPIDGFIIDSFGNRFAVQLKYASFLTTSNGATVSCRKSKKQVPYSENDGIDYLIVEIGGTKEEPDERKGRFFFLPLYDLIENNIFSSDASKGKTTIKVVFPHRLPSQVPHWSTLHLDNYQLKRRIHRIKSQSFSSTLSTSSTLSSSSSSSSFSSKSSVSAKSSIPLASSLSSSSNAPFNDVETSKVSAWMSEMKNNFDAQHKLMQQSFSKINGKADDILQENKQLQETVNKLTEQLKTAENKHNNALKKRQEEEEENFFNDHIEREERFLELVTKNQDYLTEIFDLRKTISKQRSESFAQRVDQTLERSKKVTQLSSSQMFVDLSRQPFNVSDKEDCGFIKHVALASACGEYTLKKYLRIHGTDVSSNELLESCKTVDNLCNHEQFTDSHFFIDLSLDPVNFTNEHDFKEMKDYILIYMDMYTKTLAAKKRRD